MAHPHSSDPIVGGDGFDYPTGVNWLPLSINKDQTAINREGVQAQSGATFMQQMIQMLTSPTAGPVGLAAAARYGSSAGISDATGGQGVDMSGPQSYLDSVMKAMADYSSKLGIDASAAEFIPNDGAESAPTAVSSTNPIPPGAPANTPTEGYTDWGPYMDDINRMMNLRGGGTVALQGYEDGGMHPLASYSDADLDKYGGRALIQAARQNVGRGNSAAQFTNQMHNIRNLGNQLGAGLIDIPDMVSSSGGMQYTAPLNLGTNPGLEQIPTWLLLQLLQSNQGSLPYPGIANRAPSFPTLEDGGSMVIGGKKHFIVDEAGNKVAALTEDGKSEEVKGVGGVEVIPLDPMRKALYESRKRQTEMSDAILQKEEELKPTSKVDPNRSPMLTPEDAAKVPNVLPKEIANLDGGGFQQLPNQWVGGGEARGVAMPTQGGPQYDRQELIGQREDFRSGGDASWESLLELADSGEGETDKAHFAKLLGGFMSDESGAVDVKDLRRLNQGLAPEKLMSASRFATLDAPIQMHYASLLEQMGIITSPEDLIRQQKKFTPTSIQ